MVTSTRRSAEGVDRSWVVSWKGRDGTVHSAGPLSRDRAESLARAYAEVYPDEPHWAQPAFPEVEELQLGPLQRSRVRKGSSGQ
jgi:hypothetical protein